jgi:hypothetical protein
MRSIVFSASFSTHRCSSSVNESARVGHGFLMADVQMAKAVMKMGNIRQ